MYFSGLNKETIGQLVELTKGLKAGELKKAVVDSSTGFTGYNLDPKVKLLITQPWIVSPFRQRIPRRTTGGTGYNWKKIASLSRSGGFKAADGTKANTWAVT